ncbi:M23 family metallopeptidase [Streptomyces montanisoli]|uniref:M23 family metallopeptidase n=1 Tax=Streptomyces montanisoli TaxID=2798581 RepID=A0A940RYV3_9ACTN|nr:M23 family metallopeptidase [Streptomyces montanisoli]MBP0459084.1 M23 family metallopeptidase [Streptomyces montanisoli]
MNDQHAQAGYAAYETDPLFGALPDGYDAQRYTDQPQQYGTAQYTRQYEEQYADHQHAYAAAPAAAWAGQPADYPYAYGHDPTDTLGGGYDAQDAWGYHEAPTAYEPTVQWAVLPQAGADEAPAAHDAAWYASQDTLVAEMAPPAEQVQAEPVEAEPEPAGSPVAPASAPDPAPRASTRRAAATHSRRRAPAKRSALFTIAVPSACVMGVAGIAAASVGAIGGGDGKQDDTASAAADPADVKPIAANNKLDTQLAALNADARDFGDRASRTQERIDLKARQAAEKKKREEEAARKEAARPKYLLPVKRRGLSAYFGQAGVNWMSVHTGIDFPVMTGTPVMAATDGTVRTQWNSSYGNMAIVTAPDGTETWYCHLSSTRVRSGSVKAGDVIAYSGNTGNTTGPHLHFEVRPHGGAAIDPLPWLRSHGLDPT